MLSDGILFTKRGIAWRRPRKTRPGGLRPSIPGIPPWDEGEDVNLKWFGKHFLWEAY
jgi:hypothetical protein